MQQDSTGGIYFKISLDNSQLKKDAEQANRILNNLGKQTEKIDLGKAVKIDLSKQQQQIGNLSLSLGGARSAIDAVTAAQELATLTDVKAIAGTGLLTKVKTIYTAVLTRMTAAMGGSVVAAQALTGTLTLGLSVAVGLLIKLMDDYNRKNEEAAAKLKEAVDMEKSAIAAKIKTRVELDNEIESIERFNGTKEQQKKKISELNSKYGESFGYYKTLDEWYSVLIRKGEDYVNVILNQARAQAEVNKIVELEQKKYEIEQTNKRNFRKVGGETIVGGVVEWFNGDDGTEGKADALKEINKELERRNDNVKYFNNQTKYFQNRSDLDYHTDPDKGKSGSKTKKTEDPFIKSLEERKKQYTEYVKLLNSSDEDVRASASSTFKSLIKDGETYLDYLSGVRDKLLDHLTDNPGDKTAAAHLQAVRSRIADIENGSAANEEAERTRALAAIEKQREDLITESELRASQARINGMEAGFEKEMAQAELNFKKEQMEAEKRLQKMIELEADRQEQMHKAAYKGTGIVAPRFDRTTVTEASLSSTDLMSYSQDLELNQQKNLQENKAILEKLLKDYQTFEERRTAITAKYQKQRKDLTAAGVLDDEREQLVSEQEAQALNALDLEVAKKNELFQSWMHSLTGKTLANLEAVLREAEMLLKNALSGGSAGQELAIARARVEEAKKAVTAAKNKQNENPDKQASQEWKVLGDSIHNAASALNVVSESFEGATQDALRTAATILNSSLGVMDAVKNVSTSSAAAISGTAKVAAAAISTVEKASVILTVISLVIQAVTAAINFSKRQAERIRETTVNIRDLNIELDRLQRRNVMNSTGGIFGEDKWLQAQRNVRGLNEAYKELDKTLSKVYAAYGASKERWDHIFETNQVPAFKGWDQREAIIASTNILIGKKDNALIDLFPKLFTESGIDYDMLGEFINSELFKKLDTKVQDMLIELKEDWESYKDYLDATKEYLGSIFGELGNQMSDAMVDAFRNGESAAKSFTYSVSKMLETLAKQIIYSMTIAPHIKKAEEAVLAISTNAGLSDDQKFEAYTGILTDLIDNAVGEQERANQLYKKYQDIADGKGLEIFSGDTRTGTNKGLTAMTQDTGEELNGRFAVIQGHTFELMNRSISMDVQMRLLTAQSAQQLRHLAGIETNTHTLHEIRGNIASMKNAIEIISERGVKMF
ncbi:MAG: hypothetical protein KF870_07315 [Leadbetterella sp.]|nr:hypothetical protein [Leadbetterella sp.]